MALIGGHAKETWMVTSAGPERRWMNRTEPSRSRGENDQSVRGTVHTPAGAFIAKELLQPNSLILNLNEPLLLHTPDDLFVGALAHLKLLANRLGGRIVT